MYYPNQVVWSFDLKAPVQIGDDVWDTAAYPKGRTTHFMDGKGEAACPKSIEEANILLQRNRITPAPVSESHCWSCHTWLSHRPEKGCIAEDEHDKCDMCSGYETYGERAGKTLCAKCWFSSRHSELMILANELVKTLEGSTDIPSKIISQIAEFR